MEMDSEHNCGGSIASGLYCCHKPKRRKLSNELAYFDFKWDGIENHTPHQILALKKTRIERPRLFSISNPKWDAFMFASVIKIFRYFIENNILWDTFELNDDNGLMDLDNYKVMLRPIISMANRFHLFKRFQLEVISDDGAMNVMSEDEIFFADINMNARLEALDVRVWGRVTHGDSLALKQLFKTSSKLKELSYKVENFNQPTFCEGLDTNKTLEKVKLDFGICNLLDEEYVKILASLSGLPKLKELFIDAIDKFGQLASRELQQLLSTSSTLSTLHLNVHEFALDHGRIDLEHILQGLKESRSLKRLQLAEALNGKFLFSRILSILPECPSLEHICLWESLVTVEDLDRVISLKRLKRPIEFDLDYSIMRYNTKKVMEIIQAHPELRLCPRAAFCAHYYESHNFSKPICDLNWHGKYLLDRPKTPVGLWPKVLERANNEPHVLYEFLKGPAFAGRSNLL
jgi:hypothetical protein